MTAREILVKARELIADPKRWTQRAYARDAYGSVISATSPSAASWCSVGAVLCAAVSQETLSEGDKALAFLDSNATNKFGTTGFNDTHTHPEVLEVFDRAILAAEVA